MTGGEGGLSALSSLRCPASLESRGSASCLARSAGKRSAGPFSIPLRPCALATFVHPCTSGLLRASCPPPFGPPLRGVQIRSRRICPNPKGFEYLSRFAITQAGVNTPGLGNGGEGGIRTLGAFLTHTHFPGVLLKPLGHLSGITHGATRQNGTQG